MLRSLTILIFITLSVDQLTGQLNQQCRNAMGDIGTCTRINACVQSDFVTPDQLNTLRNSPCGYDSGTLVCCTTKQQKQPQQQENTQTSSRRQQSTNILPDRTTCGIQLADRIYNGESTSLDEFPWMAILEYQNDNGKKGFYCGGALISSRYILTAAHCVKGTALNTLRLVNVRLGEFDLTTNPDCQSNGNYQECVDPHLDVSVEKIIAHQDYDPKASNKYNDIALLRLNKNVEFTDYIKPICLPGKNDESPIGQKLSVSGWGATEDLSRSNIKLKTQVPKVSRDECSRQFRKANVDLSKNQICAGGVNGKDSCRGDSGGPLMTTFKNDSSQWYMEGIVSFGNRCGEVGWPGVYTKVYNYIDWIKANMEP